MGTLNSRDHWQRTLAAHEQRLGLTEGFKFLYGPWSTLTTGGFAFLSLNPGVAPDGADLRTVSDERGNSYVVEQLTTRSPITDQYLRLAELVGVDPSAILAGVVIPFRSASVAKLTTEQRSTGLDLAADFWREPLARPALRTIVASGQEAGDFVVNLLAAHPDSVVPSGWGGIVLRRFRTPDGRAVVQLPHLSRFKLLSRPACMQPLRTVLALSH